MAIFNSYDSLPEGIPRFIPVRTLHGTIISSSHSSLVELREEIPPGDHGQQRGTAQHLIVHGAETDLLGQEVEEVHGPEVWHLDVGQNGRPLMGPQMEISLV